MVAEVMHLNATCQFVSIVRATEMQINYVQPTLTNLPPSTRTVSLSFTPLSVCVRQLHGFCNEKFCCFYPIMALAKCFHVLWLQFTTFQFQQCFSEINSWC